MKKSGKGKRSAGILLYRKKKNGLEVLLVHPGGPLWVNKDEGAWSIPKGEYTEGEDPLACAKREFLEETGTEVSGEFIALSPLRLKSGKLVHAWTLEGDMDTTEVKSNLFELEWPPRSGKVRKFPEVDRAEWFPVAEARARINPGQAGFLDELIRIISG